MSELLFTRFSVYGNSTGSRPTIFALAPLRIILPWVYNIRPAGLRRKMVEWAPSKKIQRLKDIIDVQDLQVR